MNPTIGMGATIRIGSDRYPATVIDVQRNGKTIVLQHDMMKRADQNGLSEDQTYLYVPNPNGKIEKATLRKHGKFCVTGTDYIFVHLGERDGYRDPSF